MTDLLWPGAERSDSTLSDRAFIDAMISVEQAWLDSLVELGVAPVPSARLVGLLDPDELPMIAAAAEQHGSPVIPLLDRLRREVKPEVARWLHRGLTSQDVIDSALMLCLTQAITSIRNSITAQAQCLIKLASQHRESLQAGRTLTTYAVPITFGLKTAHWLTDVSEAAEQLPRSLPVQLGGAAGTNAALVEICSIGSGDPRARARQVISTCADRLGLVARPPWPTNRSPITRAGDALAGCCDAFGHIAGDVLVLSRPEIDELRLGRTGGSSTMPHKQNPVLATLIRRAAVVAPGYGSTLHRAAADATDERAAGEWQAEWATLRNLARVTVIAATQTADLLAVLSVQTDTMAARADAARDSLLAERAAIGQSNADADLSDYLGSTDEYIDDAIFRARQVLELSA